MANFKAVISFLSLRESGVSLNCVAAELKWAGKFGRTDGITPGSNLKTNLNIQ